ncbi:putative peroxiredoxin bcp [compost metagenome]
MSDGEHVVCEQYGVWQLKKLYGREYMGLVRSTFLIDGAGRLVREWRKVRVKGHAEQVLEAVRELHQSASSSVQ